MSRRPSSYHARRFAGRHSSGFAGIQLARLRYLVACRSRHGDDVFSIERVSGDPASGTHVIEWHCRSGRIALRGVSEQYARRFGWHFFQLFLLPALCDHYAGRGQVAGAPAAVPDVVTRALVRRDQGLPAAAGGQARVSELACEYDAPDGRELPASPPVVCGDCHGAPCYRDGHEYRCPDCGALYNAFGQRLKPRSDWPASARVREPKAGEEIDPGEYSAGDHDEPGEGEEGEGLHVQRVTGFGWRVTCGGDFCGRIERDRENGEAVAYDPLGRECATEPTGGGVEQAVSFLAGKLLSIHEGKGNVREPKAGYLCAECGGHITCYERGHKRHCSKYKSGGPGGASASRVAEREPEARDRAGRIEAAVVHEGADWYAVYHAPGGQLVARVLLPARGKRSAKKAARERLDVVRRFSERREWL